ncbi:MAG TPA: ANTAR domain-containing protein [Nocardioides sp.]|uniref:ANTAR domain-containing protein n=1 Tax=Nocardioides sp. TaxID=35761 RepID=UPI002F41B366
MDEVRPDGAELWQLIETLTDQVKSGQADIAALVTRADRSDARADASEVRADLAEARAEIAEARADQADIRADIGEIRMDKIEAAELVDREMIAELQADGELSREHAREMEQALRSSRVIGAAIGVLMVSRDLNEDQAFAVLAKASQDSNRKLRDVAQLLVRGTPGAVQFR